MTQAPDALIAFSNLIGRLVTIAREEGLPSDEIHRKICGHALMLAADMHVEGHGSDESFLRMARRALALARTGTTEH